MSYTFNFEIIGTKELDREIENGWIHQGYWRVIRLINKVIIEEFSEAYQKQVSELILNIQQNEYSIAITKEDQPVCSKFQSFIR